MCVQAAAPSNRRTAVMKREDSGSDGGVGGGLEALVGSMAASPANASLSKAKVLELKQQQRDAELEANKKAVELVRGYGYSSTAVSYLLMYTTTHGITAHTSDGFLNATILMECTGAGAQEGRGSTQIPGNRCSHEATGT